MGCRLCASESVQYFQFDKEGNMFVLSAGSGCTGEAKLVRPGDELIFNDHSDVHQDSLIVKSEICQDNASFIDKSINIASSQRSFKAPLEADKLQTLSHEKFSDETMKKVKWATTMYNDWRLYRNSLPNLDSISCDILQKETVTHESLMFALTRFITEVKKVDLTDFPGKTLYEIIICIQFHLETEGFSWKILN